MVNILQTLSFSSDSLNKYRTVYYRDELRLGCAITLSCYKVKA